MISWSDFEKVEMRVGKVIDVQDFPEARKPAYQLKIDFGPEIGIKKSSAQITKLYTKEQMLNRLIVCVTNFPPKQIGPFISEVLTCGTANAEGDIVLLSFESSNIPLGSKIY
ncbi:tRNA-binding protein [Candidatus Gracilibacteria bacterium]|nr:tRNA-binding protein [Candidatus Gracilibacteria bacterium]